MTGSLTGWLPRQKPDGRTLDGRLVRLEKLDARHGADLGLVLSGHGVERLYDYLPEPVPAIPADVEAWVAVKAASPDPFFYAIIDKASNQAIGRMALMRIDAANGVIEVGNILYSPHLQRGTAATEAQFLFLQHVFDDLGYRRYEWKCNNRNEPSKRAALRYGFSYEGLFRQHMIVKGENRDTAWFSIVDHEWPRLKHAYQSWLDPANFTADGRQRVSLASLTSAALGRDEGLGT